MTAHGVVVRSYEPEEMEPTKKQRFCVLVMEVHVWMITLS